MRPWTSPTLGFRAGVLGKGAQLLRDARIYGQSARTLHNVWPLSATGVRRRPGWRFRDTTATTLLRLVPFVFAQDQRYLLVLESDIAKVYDGRDGTYLTTVNGCPWDDSQVADLDFCQQGDTLIVCHEAFPPFVIERTGFATFDTYDFEFEQVEQGNLSWTALPKVAPVTPNIWLTPDGTTGTINVQVDTPGYFTPGHNGVIIDFGPDAISCLINNVKGNGTHLILKVQGGASLPDTKPTNRWTEQAFSFFQGYPRAVGLHAERLWFAGTAKYPNGVWGSKLNAFFNFDVSGQDNDGISAVIVDDEQVPRIRHIVSSQRLVLVADHRIFTSIVAQDGSIPASKFGVRPQGTSTVRPVKPARYDGSMWFLSGAGQLHEFAYDVTGDGSSDAWTANCVSLRCPELLTDPVRMAVYPGQPGQGEPLLLIVNSAGDMVPFRSVKSEQVTAFYTWDTQGTWLDVCRVGDGMFAACDRGQGLVTIEMFDPEATLDCSVVAGQGFGHLAGRTVQLAAGDVLLEETVAGAGAGGSLPDPPPYPWEQLGLGYAAEIDPNDPDGLLMGMQTVASTKRMVWLGLYLDRVSGLTVQGRDVLPDETPTDSGLVAPLGGLRRAYLLGYGRDIAPTITIGWPCHGAVYGLVQHLGITGAG